MSLTDAHNKAIVLIKLSSIQIYIYDLNWMRVLIENMMSKYKRLSILLSLLSTISHQINNLYNLCDVIFIFMFCDLRLVLNCFNLTKHIVLLCKND